MTDTQRVGLDISTMEAIQSLGRTDRHDPWALDCFATWVDVIVNHAEPRFALPKALGELDAEVDRRERKGRGGVYSRVATSGSKTGIADVQCPLYAQ